MLVVNLAQELSKPKCQCSRCEWEQEAWQDYTKRPWVYNPIAKAERDTAMREISPSWCSECEVFNDCECGKVAAFTGEPLLCGGFNPCEEHSQEKALLVQE